MKKSFSKIGLLLSALFVLMFTGCSNTTTKTVFVENNNTEIVYISEVLDCNATLICECNGSNTTTTTTTTTTQMAVDEITNFYGDGKEIFIPNLDKYQEEVFLATVAEDGFVINRFDFESIQLILNGKVVERWTRVVEGDELYIRIDTNKAQDSRERAWIKFQPLYEGQIKKLTREQEVLYDAGQYLIESIYGDGDLQDSAPSLVLELGLYLREYPYTTGDGYQILTDQLIEWSGTNLYYINEEFDTPEDVLNFINHETFMVGYTNYEIEDQFVLMGDESVFMDFSITPNKTTGLIEVIVEMTGSAGGLHYFDYYLADENGNDLRMSSKYIGDSKLRFGGGKYEEDPENQIMLEAGVEKRFKIICVPSVRENLDGLTSQLTIKSIRTGLSVSNLNMKGPENILVYWFFSRAFILNALIYF